MSRAVFIDKDGTLVRDVPYNVDPANVIFHDGAVEALKMLKEKKYKLIMITNQSGIAKGYFKEQDLEALFAYMQEKLLRVGVGFDDYYFCPHHPCGIVDEYSIECDCRKPQPGLILRASSKWNIDLGHSWMIGDILNDVETGNRAGCKTILIDNGGETEWKEGPFRKPDATVDSLYNAATLILEKRNCEIEV
jgi:D,D-heptose 1,7-bisphosphate phosphatase